MNNWREQKRGSRWEKVGLKIEADVKRPSQTLNNEGDATEMGVTCWVIDVNPEIVEEWLWGLFYEGDEMLLPFNLQDSLRQNPLSAGGEHLSPHSQESIHGQTSSRRCTQYPPTHTKIPNYRQNFHVAHTPDLLPLRSLKLFISILWLGSHTFHSPILPRRMHRHPLLHTKEVIRVYRWRSIYRLTSSHSFHWRRARIELCRRYMTDPPHSQWKAKEAISYDWLLLPIHSASVASHAWLPSALPQWLTGS